MPLLLIVRAEPERAAELVNCKVPLTKVVAPV